jgi:hypothetical protein
VTLHFADELKPFMNAFEKLTMFAVMVMLPVPLMNILFVFIFTGLAIRQLSEQSIDQLPENKNKCQ